MRKSHSWPTFEFVATNHHGQKIKNAIKIKNTMKFEHATHEKLSSYAKAPWIHRPLSHDRDSAPKFNDDAAFKTFPAIALSHP